MRARTVFLIVGIGGLIVAGSVWLLGGDADRRHEVTLDVTPAAVRPTTTAATPSVAAAAVPSQVEASVTTYEPVTTHEPVTHLVDVVTADVYEVRVGALQAATDSPQLDPGKIVVLSEGLELVLVGAAVSEEPRVVPDAHRGTYVLSNSTGRSWSGIVLCLRNYEQVRCGETADVWSVGLDPGESARMQISVRPVGPSGRGDHIQLIPIAGAGSDHIGRVGGVYASAAPDKFEDSVPVAPTEADTRSLECGTASVEGDDTGGAALRWEGVAASGGRFRGRHRHDRRIGATARPGKPVPSCRDRRIPHRYPTPTRGRRRPPGSGAHLGGSQRSGSRSLDSKIASFAVQPRLSQDGTGGAGAGLGGGGACHRQ